jgi:hypothetical protein
VHIQNVERQNVERQNIERQNVDTSKRRQLQNVDFFLLAAIYKTEYWFTPTDHNMKCTVCVVIIFRRIFCIYPSRIFVTIKLSESIQTFLVMTIILNFNPLPPNLNPILT